MAIHYFAKDISQFTMFTTNSAAPVWFGEGALENLQGLIRQMAPSRIFFLVDENTHDKCLPYLLKLFPELPENEVLEVPAGEESKSPEVLMQLWLALAEMKADRQCLLINVGGGMVTDLGGFLGGTYLRGVAFINVPTSLLAMVDASVGGKNGLNLNHEKNRVGLFLEPMAVCILPEFLETLPARERRSGFAEMLKHGLIADEAYWRELSAFDIKNEMPTAEMIKKSVEIKQKIVKADFRESGQRKILNFGHSLGHAIESLALENANPLLHGEAIALGMIGELQLSEKYTGLPSEKATAAMGTLRTFFPALAFSFKASDLLLLMQSDKKNVDGQMRFSLLSELGKAVPDVPVREADLEAVLTKLMEH